MNVETVREQQAGARRDVRLDDLPVKLRLHHVRREHGDQFGIGDRFGRRFYAEAVGLGPGFGRPAGSQADGDVETRIAQVECVGAALAAVADEGDARMLGGRSEELTSELRSLMSISDAVSCLKKTNTNVLFTTIL